MKKYSIIVVFAFFTSNLFALYNSVSYDPNDDTVVESLIGVVESEYNWTLRSMDNPQNQEDVFHAVEILGSIRCTKSSQPLIKRINCLTRTMGGLPRGFKDAYVAAALVRIADYQCIKIVLEQEEYFSIYPFYSDCFFGSVMPLDSMIAVIDDYLETSSNLSVSKKEKILNLKQRLLAVSHVAPEKIPSLSDFTLNHQLYKKHQSVIDLNLLILKEQRNIIELNLKTFNAIQKLGELRAVEAVEVLTPYLLLQSTTEVIKPDEKYTALKKYPVAVSLAQIGIPSIRGLLKEIAQGNGDNPGYVEISYKTMSTILPSVAILGFVDEAIENEKSEEAKSRLEKLYPFLPQQDEIDQRIKKRQEQEKTEK
ncbi:MAG: hypothetical protein LBG58_02870 [Planctomycetaceae bacterium]|nr:hypothetical protein [Planctomycetaceae bacterium]